MNQCVLIRKQGHWHFPNRPQAAERAACNQSVSNHKVARDRSACYWQTGPASCRNVALLENHPFTPTDGAP